MLYNIYIGNRFLGQIYQGMGERAVTDSAWSILVISPIDSLRSRAFSFGIDPLSPSERNAKRFATQAHSKQVRKYTGDPYIIHPAEVAELVRSIPHTETMLMAAWLHDTVEDTEVSLSDIERIFGPEVALLLESLTDVSRKEDGNRARRKEIDLEHTSRACPDAKTVKLADLISNSRSIVEYDPDFAKVYMREKSRLLDILQEGDKTLYAQARKIVDNYEKR